MASSIWTLLLLATACTIAGCQNLSPANTLSWNLGYGTPWYPYYQPNYWTPNNLYYYYYPSRYYYSVPPFYWTPPPLSYRAGISSSTSDRQSAFAVAGQETASTPRKTEQRHTEPTQEPPFTTNSSTDQKQTGLDSTLLLRDFDFVNDFDFSDDFDFTNDEWDAFEVKSFEETGPDGSVSGFVATGPNAAIARSSSVATGKSQAISSAASVVG